MSKQADTHDSLPTISNQQYISDCNEYNDNANGCKQQTTLITQTEKSYISTNLHHYYTTQQNTSTIELDTNQDNWERNSRDNVAYGDSIENKGESVLRIYYQNIHGIK